ncbi:MAG TPA: hypothetical protein VFV55_09910 [Usitatibacteraceae bacterium]|nr:hypothetical protein [Usitatibacteraceae bacterium]
MTARTPHLDPEARKQRLLREALGNAGGFMPSAERVGKVFVAVGLSLTAAVAISSGLPFRSERVVTLAAYPNVPSAGQGLPVTQPGGEDDRAAPEGNVQDLTY